MSLSKSKIARRGFILSAFALASCGFEPLYSGGHGGSGAFRGKIQLPSAKTEDLYYLRRELASAFGEANDPLYALEISYSASSAGLDIPQSAVGQRGRVRASGSYELTRISDGAVIVSRPINQELSYGYRSGAFENDEIKEDTRYALAKTVGNEISSQLVIALSRQNP